MYGDSTYGEPYTRSQWHDALTGWARPWRWVISGMAGLAASGCMLIVVALSVLVMAYSPINNGDYASPDDRQSFSISSRSYLGRSRR